MMPVVVYAKEYGWHCGRLLLWPALLLGSALGIFILVPIGLVLDSLTKTHFPFALIVPAAFVFYLVRRTRRKLAGEPLAWYTLGADSFFSRLLIIRRDESPKRFWFLIWFDIVIWSSAAALLSALILAPYAGGYGTGGK